MRVLLWGWILTEAVFTGGNAMVMVDSSIVSVRHCGFGVGALGRWGDWVSVWMVGFILHSLRMLSAAVR
jgi:hypothetical protein